MRDTLYYGDNLEVLRDYIPDHSVDLVYLDPPFNSDASYNVLFREKTGEKSPSQIRAFTDTWHWTEETEQTFQQDIIYNTNVPSATKEMVAAFRQILGEKNDMMAYLVMMTPRLVDLRRALKSSGSLYLHCDPTASHYLKVLMDTIFDTLNFRNEVIWKRTTAHSSARKYAPIHDSILYYVKTAKSTWEEPRLPYTDEYLNHYYKYDDGDGRLYWRADLCAAGIRKGRWAALAGF
jgi:adenine specific DNA methylase Mod